MFLCCLQLRQSLPTVGYVPLGRRAYGLHAPGFGAVLPRYARPPYSPAAESRSGERCRDPPKHAALRWKVALVSRICTPGVQDLDTMCARCSGSGHLRSTKGRQGSPPILNGELGNRPSRDGPSPAVRALASGEGRRMTSRCRSRAQPCRLPHLLDALPVTSELE